MKLFYAPNSPYARKCRVVIREKELKHVEEVLAMPADNPPELLAVNPLGTVPALQTGEGPLCDSALICEYLDALPSARPPLFPAGPARMKALRLAALADGIMDAAVSCVLEQRKAAERRSPEWIDRKEKAILRSIAATAKDRPDEKAPLDIGTLGLACALDYVRFRCMHLDWQGREPELAAWLEHALQRPSFGATAPLP
jgi:glutathione S-transferase